MTALGDVARYSHHASLASAKRQARNIASGAGHDLSWFTQDFATGDFYAECRGCRSISVITQTLRSPGLGAGEWSARLLVTDCSAVNA